MNFAVWGTKALKVDHAGYEAEEARRAAGDWGGLTLVGSGIERSRSVPMLRTVGDGLPIRPIAAARSRPRSSSKSTAELVARGRVLRARFDAEAEIPELRPNATPTITIRLTRLARETIHDELDRSWKLLERGHETGGWLFGVKDRGKWLISATDLGPGRRMVNEVALIYEHARHEAYRQTWDPATRASIRFCNSWHVHPRVGSTAPSAPDRANALRAFAEFPELNPPDFALDLIVSPHADYGYGVPQFHAWATRRDRWAGAITEPVTIEGPTTI